MKIIWSPLAIDRAAEIAGYISLDNPAAANKWIEKIFEKVEVLSTSPEINSKEIRELIFGNYRIIYRLEKPHISILTIRHDKQILPVDEIMA